jgi:hypothetical protein
LAELISPACSEDRDSDAVLEHFANIGHLMAPLMVCATITGELLGAPNDQIRRNLTGDQPKLFEPWLTINDVVGG